MNNAYRYAIYFAPRQDSLFWQAGSQWLGRCAASQRTLAQPAIPDLDSAAFSQLTAAPRRYGWHATLKAPFSLAPGVAVSDLLEALRKLCDRLEPFTMPPLALTRLDDFLALTPTEISRQIQEIEKQCVTELQSLSAPLSSEELTRRRQAGLSRAEDVQLLRWGYPYVLEHFRFHMSLTGSLRACSAQQVDSLMQAGSVFFGDLRALSFDSVAVFAEPAQGNDFVLLEQIGFGG